MMETTNHFSRLGWRYLIINWQVLYEYKTETGDGTSAVVPVSSVKPTTSLFVFKSTVPTHYGDPERRLISAMVRQRVEVIRARC